MFPRNQFIEQRNHDSLLFPFSLTPEEGERVETRLVEEYIKPVKEISPEYSLEGMMLKLKLQYFGHLMQRADSLEKALMLGKVEGRRRRR